MTTSAAFQQAAHKTDTGAFNYAREVEQVWRDFPETKDKIFFFDIGKFELIYPESGFHADKVKKDLYWSIDSDRNLLCNIEQYGKDKTSFYSTMNKYRSGKMALLYTEQDVFSFVGDVMSFAHYMTFIFDHELAHALVQNEQDKAENFQECLADSYATIRHLQRYGANSSVIDAVVFGRANRLVFTSGKSHFSSPVTEQILLHRHKIDWSSLSPQDVVHLSRQFAEKYALRSEALEDLSQKFNKVRATGKLNDLVEKLAAADSDLSLKWGTVVLDAYIKGQLKIKHSVQPIASNNNFS